jgi:hypothetical protein
VDVRFAILALCVTGCAIESQSPVDTRAVEPIAGEPAPVAYPSGPYALAKGAIIPNACFEGYRDGKPPLTLICMSDFFDPDGSRGVNAVAIEVGAEWCTPSVESLRQLVMLDAAVRARGGRFVGALGQDSKGDPASQTTLERISSAHRLTIDLVADPLQKLSPTQPGHGIPLTYVVDPRTMRIVRINEGTSADPSVPGFEQLLTANGG